MVCSSLLQVGANIAHDHGFFVGNHPHDLARELDALREVLDRAASTGSDPITKLK